MSVCSPDAKSRTGRNERRGEATVPGIPLHLLAAAVKLRVAQPDCFAGTVFRVEPSAYCTSLADAAVAIARGLQQEDLVIVMIKVRVLAPKLGVKRPTAPTRKSSSTTVAPLQRFEAEANAVRN